MNNECNQEYAEMSGAVLFAKSEVESASVAPHVNHYPRKMQMLACKSGSTTAVLLFILEQMDGYNGVMCSHKLISEALDLSLPTVTRAIRTLADDGFIKIIKSGSANVYYTEDKLEWTEGDDSKQIARLSNVHVLVAKSEQDD